MKSGFVKLYRRFLKNTLFKNARYVQLWIYLLLRAAYKDSEILWNSKIIGLKAGQFITGRKRISIETGIPEATTEDMLNLLERQHQIRQQKTNKYRIISIQNWHKYQNEEENPTAKPTTQQQQGDTNKNYIKKESREFSLFSEWLTRLIRERLDITPFLNRKDEGAFWEFRKTYSLEDCKDLVRFYFNSSLGNKFWSLATILQPVIVNRWLREKAKANNDYE